MIMGVFLGWKSGPIEGRYNARMSSIAPRRALSD